MHNFLNDDLNHLFAVAKQAGSAPPLDSAAVMRRIQGVYARPVSFALAQTPVKTPLRWYIGISSFAAMLAIVVAALAMSAWTSLHDPLWQMGMLPDIVSFLQSDDV